MHRKNLMIKFTDLGLAAPLLKALDSEGYTSPTPIQVQAIPAILEARDLLGIAQTGTGKTAAFALPILHSLNANRQRAPKRSCRVLVLSPTRELASQIADSFEAYGKYLGVTVAAVFGGVGYGKQVQALSKGVDVLIATPGRLQDHIASGQADLSGTEVFVLDEADQMLDLGFLKPIKQIASELSLKRQTLFFSATMPKEIARLASTFLRDPIKVTVTPAATTVERIAQRVIHVEKQKKISLLSDVLFLDGPFRALVFTRTKRGADRIAKQLTRMRFSAAAIHGNKSQNQREGALDAFKKSDIQVLVATDIAARGIDVEGVTHVVNYDLPEVPDAYVHRIGRTARAGASGQAISFCAPDEKHLLRSIEKLTRQTISSEDRRNDERLANASEGQKERATRDRRPKNRKTTGNDVRRPAPARRRNSSMRRSDNDRNTNGVPQAAGYDPAQTKAKPSTKRPQERAGPKGSTAKNSKRPTRDSGSALSEMDFLKTSVRKSPASESAGTTGSKKRRKLAKQGPLRPAAGPDRSEREKYRTRVSRPFSTT